MCAEIVHDHSTEAIRERLESGNEASYLRDWIYGGIDGAVTTFAIVSGVIGADLSTKVILILGAANIVADGFSMAASNYTGTKAENEEFVDGPVFEGWTGPDVLQSRRCAGDEHCEQYAGEQIVSGGCGHGGSVICRCERIGPRRRALTGR